MSKMLNTSKAKEQIMKGEILPSLLSLTAKADPEFTAADKKSITDSINKSCSPMKPVTKVEGASSSFAFQNGENVDVQAPSPLEKLLSAKHGLTPRTPM